MNYTCTPYCINAQGLICSQLNYSVINSIVGTPPYTIELTYSSTLYTSQIASQYLNIVDTRRVTPNFSYVITQFNNTLTKTSYPFNLAYFQDNIPIIGEFIAFGSTNFYFNQAGTVTLYNPITTNATSLSNLPIIDIGTTDALDVGNTLYWKTGSTLYTYNLTTQSITNSVQVPPNTYLGMSFFGPYIFGEASGLVYLYQIYTNQAFYSTLPVWSSFVDADLIPTSNNSFVITSLGTFTTDYFGLQFPNIYLVSS